MYANEPTGDNGTGIIDSITYQNIEAHGSLWYPIWIGPQQERQPGWSSKYVLLPLRQ